MKGESKNFLFRVSKCQRFLNSFSFFLTNTKKKLDLLVRPFDRNLSHWSLPVIREREREREREYKAREAIERV